MREIIGGLDDKAYGLSPMLREFQIYEVNDSMTKRELVQSLPKVKLVLGNGFDLHCGLNTRYADFFNANLEKYQNIIDWVQKFASVERYLKEDHQKNEFWQNLKSFDHCNFWDVVFCLHSYENRRNEIKDISNWNWCDIESVMQKWVKKNPEIHDEANLDDVYSAIKNEKTNYVGTKSDYLFLAAFLMRKRSKLGLTKERFYTSILKELKTFEKSFGEFVLSQTLSQEKREAYNSQAYSTFQKICNLNNIVSVDIFNHILP